MRFSHFFVDRPIFASVIAIILTLVGAISFRSLPITEYPEIAPPTVVVAATYAGASADVVADTVASPIEQEINGVDNMIYMVSQSTGNGAVSINVVFKPGTNVDEAQVLVQNLGRLQTPEQFNDIVVATDPQGTVTRVRDIARVELGAQDYFSNAYLDNQVATAIGIFQRPGSNALATAASVIATMEELSKSFPSGMAYRVAYNTTEFIQQSVDEVIKTLFEAVVLVVIVIILFLQTWRAAIIPIVAIPVSLIGTFFIMATFGFSVNNLTLFGLVLAIGIVVDDAIVVVENVERYLRQGLTPAAAAHKTMDEVGGALVAIALVLCAVFIPTAFITGISGAFYRQFAPTITPSTIISATVSLTLSPALAALFLRPHREGEDQPGLLRTVTRPLNAFFAGFNRLFDKLSSGYAGLTRRVLRISALMLVLYAGLIALTVFGFTRTPSGFIPQLDRGYFIAAVSLPPGASLERTDRVMRRA